MMTHFKVNSTDMSASSSCSTTEETAAFLHDQQLVVTEGLAAALTATTGG